MLGSIRVNIIFQKRMWKQILLLALVWEPSFGWRWKTSDAIIQEVWPETDALKSKRASDSTAQRTPKSPSPKGVDPDDDFLVFDGHYFKPNEVPPPPEFMVPHSNWLGMPAPKQQGNRAGLRPIVTERTHSKDTHAKVKTKDNISYTSKNKTSEVVSSSDAQNVFATPTSVDDFHNEEVANLKEQQELFKDAPSCFTTTDTPGKCIAFKHCFPVVFNVIDGDLRNPGLAKLLYQASGPCNATLEVEFAFRKLADEKKFLDVKFYNQTICCPGFKHPPELLLNAWANDIRNTRLSSDTKHASTDSVPKISASISETLSSRTIPTATVSGRFPTVGIHESSVELEDNDTVEDDSTEDDGIVVTVEEEIMKENSTDQASASTSERRGDRDKGQEAEPSIKPTVFHSMPAPNLSPAKCRNQQFEMPRGHWPWMVALVISSRHICSGALVDEKHVVTAAHCVHTLDETEVRKLRIILGDRVMYSSVDGPHFWRKANKIITHSNYNQRTFASDIALIKLNSAVPFSKNIQPISLPDPVPPEHIRPTIGKAIVAGWSGADIGQVSFEARTEVETVVEIMDKKECRELYRGFALSGLALNTFCTKPANNTCVADSGAPLVTRIRNCWELHGVRINNDLA
ncbi:Serine protease 45 [Orchesella cincta]|uniref:Serine protease 45 n=1 Tax=Orchesella cincta TaxID=48709 RepID=A0A1D2MZQ7_ORCCI|nr:Serine protease 45 [Orchesella cincta]